MKHLVTLLCLLGALTSYIAGIGGGVVAFVVVGVLLEVAFWVRAIGALRTRRTPS